MFRTIVVGTDGRDGGRDAIALARDLADDDATLLLTEVIAADTAPGRLVRDDLDAVLADEARARLTDAAASVPDLRAEPHVIAAHGVGAGLERVAAEHRADLIVVGSCGRGRLGRVFGGDDASGTLHAARRPVAIAPRGLADEESWRIGRIGVGFDGSAESETALAVAGRLRDAHHAHLEVIEVLPPPWPVLHGQPGVAHLGLDERERAQHDLLARPDVDRATVVAGVDAVGRLRDLAGTCDLLVVGTRPRSSFGRFAFGSTADALVHDLAAPLLVVPHVQPAAP